MTEQTEKVAKQIGVSVDALEARMTTVSASQAPAWKASGYDDEKIESLTLRISARQLHSEQTKIANSGATVLEGMMLRTPRYKDWGELRYKKMTAQLQTCDDAIKSNLVEQGAIVLFEDNHDGSWTRSINESLKNKSSFEVGSMEDSVSTPHAKAVEVDENTMYYIVADKSAPNWPSGDANWRYGAPSPASDKKRTCYFLGRKAGTSDDLKEYQIVLSGDMAERVYPTFMPGTIAVKLNKKGDTGYAKPGVTDFNADASLATMFSGPPVAFDGDAPSGLMVDALGGLEPSGRFLKGFDSLATYHASVPESEKWTAYCGLIAEVVHIDPRENGGYTITLGDLDILSSAPTHDVWVDKEQEHLITFGVGSQIAVFGTVWMRDDEARFSAQGWYCVESVDIVEADEDGWDA